MDGQMQLVRIVPWTSIGQAYLRRSATRSNMVGGAMRGLSPFYCTKYGVENGEWSTELGPVEVRTVWWSSRGLLT